MPKNKKSHPELDLELEEPQATAEQPEAGASTLFKDQLPLVATKLLTSESLLNLLTRDISFNDFTRELLLTAMKTVKCEAGSLLELDPEKRVLFFRSAFGFSSDQIVQYLIPIGKGIVGHVAETREALVVNDVTNSPVHLKSVQKAVGFTAKNLVCCPIIIRGQLYGVLELINRVGEEGFTPTDLELVTHFCAFAAKAIEVRLMLGWFLQDAKKETA